MDEITLKGLEFFGFHGCLPEEKKQGQLFVTDITMKISLEAAGKSDDIKDTVDYTKVVAIVKNMVENASKNLIESLAAMIAEAILKEFQKVEEVSIVLHKPHAALGSVIKDVMVKIVRKRSV